LKKLVVISNCIKQCPHVRTERTIGAGCADDYLCARTKAPKNQQHYREIGRHIVGYIEYPSELPKDGEFPKWCPLQEAEEGMYLEPKVTNGKGRKKEA